MRKTFNEQDRRVLPTALRFPERQQLQANNAYDLGIAAAVEVTGGQ